MDDDGEVEVEIVTVTGTYITFQRVEPQPEGWHRCCCEVQRDGVVIDSCPFWAPPDAPFCRHCENAGHTPGPWDDGRVMVPRIR